MTQSLWIKLLSMTQEFHSEPTTVVCANKDELTVLRAVTTRSREWFE